MSTARERLLVVEDEWHLAFGLQTNLELQGYAVDLAGTLEQAEALLGRPRPYSLVLLDIMLPDGSGFDLCRAMRARGDFTPILVLTARGQTHDRVAGLEAGADDYLPKPFDLAELLARVAALLRRRGWETGEDIPLLEFGAARVDFRSHQVTVGGRPVQLTALELALLRHFAGNPGRAIPRRELIEEVWRLRNWPNTRTVDNFVMRLRRHFEPDPARPVHFVSVRGVGYRFVPGG